MNDDLALYNRLTSAASNPQTQLYNALGRNAGTGGNFFTKRASSIGNAVGTTLSAPISLAHDIGENIATQKFLGDSKSRMNEVAKKYGYNSYHDVWDARDKAEAEGDQATLDFINNTINPELQAQANANAEEATAKAKGYEDYRKNNLVSKNINQDRGKFLGSAINTLSTAVDVTGLGANPLANAIQGGVEGIADELEQSGFKDFNLERAGQNALIGATTGAVTGALNQGVSNVLAKRGGNLFKGGNALTRGLNNLGSNTALGRVGSTIATGAGRGALSGAVGGATGAGISAAMNGQDVLSSALQGAAQGAQQGAFTGATMAGANMALNRTPLMRQINQAQEDWRKSGSNFDERLTNTLTSGNSAVGEWLQGNRRSGLINTIGTIGNRIADVGTGPNNRVFSVSGADEQYTFASNDKAPRAIKQAAVDYAYETDGRIDPSELTDFYNSTRNVPNTDIQGMAEAYEIETDGRVSADELLDFVRQQYGATPQARLSNTRRVDATNSQAVMDYLDEDAKGIPQTAPAYRAGEAFDEAVTDLRNNYTDTELAEMLRNTNNSKIRSVIQGALKTSNTPTTARGWLKRASERIIEDANDRGVGLSIKNVGGESYDEMPKPTSQETEVYRTLTGESEPLRTSKEYEYRQKRNQKLLDQYGTIDKPTAKAVRAVETVGEIADAGFEKPADVEAAIKKITGSDGAVNKLNRKVIANAGQINTMDGVDNGTSLTDFIDQQIRMNGLYGTNDGKALATEIEAILNQLPSRRDGTITGLDSAEDAFDVIQMLEKHAANYKGRSGSNYATSNPYKEQKAAVIESVATMLKDRIYDASDVSQVVTPDVIADMKSWYPKNEKWAKWVDQNIATAKTGADLRAAQAPFVRMGKLIDNTIINSGTFGSKVPRQLLRIATSNPLGVLINGAEMAAETPIGNRASAWVYDKLADRAARREASNPTPTPAPTPATGEPAPTLTPTSAPTPTPTPAPVPTTNTATITANPATQIYNAIGRNEGLQNGEQARTANYLADAVNQTNGETAVNNGTLESLVNPGAQTATAQNSVYDSLYGTNGTMTTANTAGQYFQPTGDYWTDLLGRAMSSAIEANDVEAFASLYGMYQDALSKQQSASESSSSQKLTATQQRANAAMNSLNRISQMTPDLGYNLSNIPIIGGIATFGGNDYESEAKSLAQQIGYMVSGANIKESEAENIGRAYVPQPWDSEQTRTNKLQRAYEIIQQYQNGYAE